MKKFLVVFIVFAFCSAMLLACGGGEKKQESGAKSETAVAKPAPEFFTAKLKCMKDATSIEDTEIPVKTLLEALDRGDWKQVTLDAKDAEKYSVAWEYVMSQGGGKSLSYTFGQSKATPTDVIIYASANIEGGKSTPIDTQLFFAKIKAQADQLKSFK